MQAKYLNPETNFISKAKLKVSTIRMYDVQINHNYIARELGESIVGFLPTNSLKPFHRAMVVTFLISNVIKMSE
jgi:hypothetical protein